MINKKTTVFYQNSLNHDKLHTSPPFQQITYDNLYFFIKSLISDLKEKS